MITAQILSPYGYSHYENQVQPDGKEALVLVPGDMRLPLVAQKYNGRHRGWTDSLALPSQQVRGYAVITMWFDESRADDMKALAEIQADALCVRLDNVVNVATKAAKIAEITKCDAKALESAKTNVALKETITAYLRVEAAKPVAVEAPKEESIEDEKP